MRQFSLFTVTDAFANLVSRLFCATLLLCVSQAALSAAPTVIAVDSTTADGTYKNGDLIHITVQFSEAVTVDTSGGTPTLELNSGATVDYSSGSGTDTLTFDYGVALNDISADLDYNATNSLSLQGGTIQNSGMETADLTLAAPGGAGSLGDARNIVIDAVPPTVGAVSATNSDGTYKIGDTIHVTIGFGESVAVDTTGGTPSLALSSGGTATYVSGSGTATLTLDYVVAESDSSADLDYLGVNSLNLNGATIRDAAGNNATLTLAMPGAANSLGDNKNIVIDGIRPTVTSVDATTPDGTYKIGDTIHVTVTFTEAIAVTVGGTPTIGLSGTDQAYYASGSGTTTLAFDYTVAVGDSSADLNYSGTFSLYLNGGAFRDAAGNDASLTLPATGAATSLGGNRNIVIDGVRPTVTSVNRLTPATASTNATSVVYRVTFSEAVTGVDSSDFAVTPTGTAAGNVASVSAVSSTVYDITVDTISGDGTLRLDLNGAATGIADGATNAISGGYSSGQTYTIDNTAAVVTSVDVPASRSYIGSVCCLYFIIFDFMDFVVHFDSPVYVSGAGGPLYIDIDVGGVSKQATYTAGSGTSALTLHWAPEVGDLDTDGIGVGSMHASGGIRLQDAAGNDANLTLNSVGDTSGVLVDGIVPTVSSINRVEATPTSASTIHYTVTFSEDVLHVDASDFSLTATGTAAGTVASVNAVSASVYTVAVSGVSGDGTLRLDLNSVPSTGITDVPGNPIETNYTSGQTFTIDANAPTVSSINRAGSDPSTTVSVDYTVTFSETVTGVDASDFTLTHTGSANGTVATVTPVSGSIYTVTVNDIFGSGTLRLDLNSSGTGIADSASNAISAGYTAGQTYTTSESIDARVSISSNGGAGIDGGNTNTYTITVTSNGPTNAHNLGIGFTAPAELTTTGTWSCVASAGTTCPNASGTYPIAETTTTLESGESLTYIVVGTVDAETVSTSITATATITPSNLQHDLSHADDTATRTDAIGVYANGFE